MIFTDEEIQQVLRSDNWSVTKDLQQIAQDYNYRIEPISAENAKVFRPSNFNKLIISSAKLKWVSMSKSLRRYNRKSKSHFRK